MTRGAWIAIVVGGIGTYAIRAVFLVFAERLTDLPPTLREALRMIPAAALAALAVPPILRPDGAFTLVSPELGAGLLAAIVAWRTKSLLATIAVGLTAILLLRAVTG